MARRAQFFFKLKARAFRHLATPQKRRENFQIARHLIVGRLTGNGKLNFFKRDDRLEADKRLNRHSRQP